MLVSPVFFGASLIARMDAADRYLPISAADLARLTAELGEDDSAYLTLRDPVGAEIVKVTNTCGGLVVDRGQDGTAALNFPRGSCIRWEMTPAEVRELICTHDCCEGGCPCEPVAAAGFTLPAARVGVPWYGACVFTGDTPMELAVTGLPSWATVTVGANHVGVRGTPTGAGTFTVSVAATNCSGAVAVQAGDIIVGA